MNRMKKSEAKPRKIKFEREQNSHILHEKKTKEKITSKKKLYTKAKHLRYKNE